MDFNAQIKISSNVATKNSYLSINSCNYLAKINEIFGNWSALTLSSWQHNNFNTSFFANTLNYLGKTYEEKIFSALTLSSWQYNNWQYNLNAITNNFLCAKCSGMYQNLSRVMVNIEDKQIEQENDYKISSNVKYQKADLENTEAYLDWNNPVPTTDSLLILSWRGSASTSNNDYIFIEYYDNEWKDISESLNYIVTDGVEYALPTFTWDLIEANDELETIGYELRIAYDNNFKSILAQIQVESNTYTLDYDHRLKSGLSYFWSVRCIDSHGGYSEWSKPKFFTTYLFEPDFIQTINGIKRLLIPYGNFEYPWYTGNLSNGIYGYSIYKYDSITGNKTPIVSPVGGGKKFIIDHSSTNPPQILNIEYDPQTYLLKFDIKIYDAELRTYNIKSIQYADQRSKITGSNSNFDMEAHDWITIPLDEIRGKRKDLESNQILNTQTSFTWTYNGSKDINKKYTYNMQIASDSIIRMLPFKWAYRNHYSNGEAAPWIINDFDYNGNFWQRYIDKYYTGARYFGKANPSGIVMNLTKFPFVQENGMLNVFDFKIYTDSILIEQANIEKSYAIVTPKQFYDAGITNVLIDLIEIENEHYELYPAEINKIISQNNNLDFYWRVQSTDQVDVSAWSLARQSNDFNQHHFEWYVLSDSNFNSTDYCVLKIEIEPSETIQKFEFPKFEWISRLNSEIDQYQMQIKRLQLDNSRYSNDLKSQNELYIRYLQDKIRQVRANLYIKLLEQGVGSTSYYNQNVHSKEIIENSEYTSDLDFHPSSIISEKDINSSEWSSVFVKFRLDATKDFNSQEGKPLREYKSIHKTCRNDNYTKCFLTTGSATSCPWIGIICPGFSIDPNLATTKFSAPIPNNPNSGYINIDAGNEYDSVSSISDYFNPGDCPMQSGGLCLKFDIPENIHESNCEICGEPRYLQFMTVSDHGGFGSLNNYYSNINPIGFSGVEIINENGSSLSDARWNPLIVKGSVQNPKLSFNGIELLKSQLPGEMNADILDKINQEPIKNSFFDNDLMGDSEDDMESDLSNGWYKEPPNENSKIQIIEII